MPLYRSRARSKRLLCGMLAAYPEADYGSLPPRVGFDSALGNGGSPKLRQCGCVEVAAHRAEAHRSCESISTCDVAAAGRRESKPPSAMISPLLLPRCSCSSCGITIAISGRAPTFTARRERKILSCALGAPGMPFHGPLHRSVIRHDRSASEADPVLLR